MKTMGGDLDNKLRSPLSVPLVSLQRRPTVLLVNPLKGDVFRGEQVLLHGSTQVSLVTKYHAVMIFPLNVLEIVDVMHIGCGQIIGTYDTCYATKCMKFVVVVVHVLRGTIEHLWARAFWHTFTGLESMLNTNAPPSMVFTMDLRIFSPSRRVSFLR